jgi:hypothetical protein
MADQKAAAVNLVEIVDKMDLDPEGHSQVFASLWEAVEKWRKTFDKKIAQHPTLTDAEIKVARQLYFDRVVSELVESFRDEFVEPTKEEE